MSFLTAEWRRLAFANYEVDPKSLQKFLPAHTELDIFNNTHYASLVGFMFKNVKLLGVKVPFHVNFEEVNLRFYVRYKSKTGWKRGVVFVKEIVPKRAVTFIANTFYNERYETQKMNHIWKSKNDSLITEYHWSQKGKEQFFKLDTELIPHSIQAGSEDEFITEHYWGYGKQTDRKTTEYEVTHPKWGVYNVNNYDIQVDFAANYGSDFEFLNAATPTSVMLAEGSPISIEGKNTIK
ncbi:YqjF family protein [Marixanthomonas ophiurae]|uniref:DUF2071 domain-containing protein n=1 Tax=Marixanthomonas ophiurae TaxID=387659 RepID=A0A3E1QD30_9FLAO|nr:DUF2071 domain-containing protein [Marixanthomonas ophiurae]RFN60004.1 DUF2071 domain-containing protein [Marixanthomonas ophiurae]